jgi:hypothetical protein
MPAAFAVHRLAAEQIYGQYNGEIAYFEAMISVSTMMRSRGFKECVSLKVDTRACTRCVCCLLGCFRVQLVHVNYD